MMARQYRHCCRRIKDIFISIQGIDHTSPKKIQVAMLLASFGENGKSPYGHILSALQSAKQNLSWESVTTRLLHGYEKKQSNQNSTHISGIAKAV